MYAPSLPRVLRFAVNPAVIGNDSISPTVTTSIAPTAYSTLEPNGRIPNPTHDSRHPQPIVLSGRQSLIASNSTISTSTIVIVFTANISPIVRLLNPK